MCLSNAHHTKHDCRQNCQNLTELILYETLPLLYIQCKRQNTADYRATDMSIDIHIAACGINRISNHKCNGDDHILPFSILPSHNAKEHCCTYDSKNCSRRTCSKPWTIRMQLMRNLHREESCSNAGTKIDDCHPQGTKPLFYQFTKQKERHHISYQMLKIRMYKHIRDQTTVFVVYRDVLIVNSCKLECVIDSNTHNRCNHICNNDQNCNNRNCLLCTHWLNRWHRMNYIRFFISIWVPVAV